MDDPEIIAQHLPELGKLPILKGYGDDGKEILEEPKNKITLKMLLTHSSGMSAQLESPLRLILRTCLRIQ
jgi:CubicO group peptidase (beta-lactamase class C family)